MVPNPYTLLSTLPPDKTWYTVLDLKDAFFSLPLAPKSQDLFAFKWTDPEKGINGQLTWTRLPQGFKNSSTIFEEALHEDLGEFCSEHPHLTLLQYVDDILLVAEDQGTCLRGTSNLLQTIAALGYRASAKKAQLLQNGGELPRVQIKRWTKMVDGCTEGNYPKNPTTTNRPPGT